MNNLADKTMVVIKEKKSSGWVWIFTSISILLLFIPILIYGIGRASFNGIVYISKHDERANIRLEKKNTKLFLKKEIKDKKELNKQLKEKAKQEKKGGDVNENGN